MWFFSSSLSFSISFSTPPPFNFSIWENSNLYFEAIPRYQIISSPKIDLALLYSISSREEADGQKRHYNERNHVIYNFSFSVTRIFISVTIANIFRSQASYYVPCTHYYTLYVSKVDTIISILQTWKPRHRKNRSLAQAGRWRARI